MTEKLPTSFEETIDFIYECQNMADATAKAEVLWPILRAAAASAEPVAWQPIETAPRDGTEVDLWCRNISHGSTDEIRFACMVYDDAGWTDWHGYNLEQKWHPTHWMKPPGGPNE